MAEVKLQDADEFQSAEPWAYSFGFFTRHAARWWVLTSEILQVGIVLAGPVVLVLAALAYLYLPQVAAFQTSYFSFMFLRLCSYFLK